MVKRIITYGLVLFLQITGFAQEPLWGKGAQGNAGSAVVTIRPSSILIKGGAFPSYPNDYIGVFIRDETGRHISLGYKKLLSSDTTNITVYKKDSFNTAGYEDGQPYFLKYWMSSGSCSIVLRNNSYDDTTINTGKHIQLDSLHGEVPEITYSSTIFKTTDPDSVQYPINTRGLKISYNSAPGGLLINTETGSIKVRSSKPGKYTILLGGEYCLKNDTIRITIEGDTVTQIVDSLDITKLRYHKNDATCVHPGSVEVEKESVKGKRPIIFTLVNNKRQTFAPAEDSVTFHNLPEGFYYILVKDAGGQVKQYPEPVFIRSKEGCNSVLLKPGDERLFIAEEGSARILNRDGILVKTIAVPGEWDCRNSSGQPVPMGDYYLFINEVQQKVITVLR